MGRTSGSHGCNGCFFAGESCCKNCSTEELKNDKPLRRHTVITPVIVAPGQARFVHSPPEFVTPQEGSEKQDCIGGQIYRQTTGPTPHFPCLTSAHGQYAYFADRRPRHLSSRAAGADIQRVK